MTQTQDTRPGLSRPGVRITVPDIILMAWESGYSYGVNVVADALDDARFAIFPIPKLTHEARVQARIREMEQCAERVRQHIKAEQAGIIPRGLAW